MDKEQQRGDEGRERGRVIREWGERHCINLGGVDLTAAFEDAETALSRATPSAHRKPAHELERTHPLRAPASRWHSPIDPNDFAAPSTSVPAQDKEAS